MTEKTGADVQELIRLAVEARKYAYAPYSQFCVGAALLERDGRVFMGCNIENAAFTPSNCAERTAFFKAVSEGARNFSAIAVAGWKYGGAHGMAYPCGVCLQVMMEFCDPKRFRVLVTSGGEYEEFKLESLLTHGFGPANLCEIICE